MSDKKKDLLGGVVNISSFGILGILLKNDYEKIQAILQIAEQLSELAKQGPEHFDAIKGGLEQLQFHANALVDSVNVLATAVIALVSSLTNPFTRLFSVFRK